jgi:hypothetical protein
VRYLVHTTEADWAEGGIFGTCGIATTRTGLFTSAAKGKREIRRAEAERVIADFMRRHGDRGRGRGGFGRGYARGGRGRGGRGGRGGGADDGQSSTDDELRDLEAEAQMMQFLDASDSDDDLYMDWRGGGGPRGGGRGGRGGRGRGGDRGRGSIRGRASEWREYNPAHQEW